MVLTCQGSKGDVYPVLGFGRAVAQRGHSVVVISSEEYERDVSRAGLDFAASCSVAEHRAAQAVLQSIALAKSQRARKRLTQDELDTLLALAPARIYSAIEANSIPGRTVVAATEEFSLGAAGMAHERLGLPHASVWHNAVFKLVAPMSLRLYRIPEDMLKNTALNLFRIGRVVGKTYSDFRRSIGLPGRRNLFRAGYSGQLNIGLFPRWFAPRFGRVMPRAVYTGFPLYAPPGEDDLPEDLQRFLQAGPRPIVFANASWRSADVFFASSMLACEALGARGVFLTQGRSSSERWQSPSISVHEAVSLPRLLPQARAFVHHAGLGSLAMGLAAGVPQLVVPQDTDQPSNARVLRRSGAGMVLRPPDYATRAATTLLRLLASEKVKRNCARLATEVGRGPDYSLAIDRLEGLLTNAPSPRRRLLPAPGQAGD